jgi:hypothetical protein
MSLRDAFFARTIDTSSHYIVDDFFVPMLQNATRYDRGVGYFSSGWLQENAKGMVEFAEKGGRARWITSPITPPSVRRARLTPSCVTTS